MDERKRDIACGLFFLIFGICLVVATTIGIDGQSSDVLGPKFVPYLASIGVCIFSIMTLISGLKKPKTQPNEELIKEERRNDLRVILFVITMIIGIILISTIGFIVGALVLTTATIFILKVRKPAWIGIIYAAIIGIYLIFVYAIQITLP